MKHFITAFFLVIISFVLQTTLFSWISFGGIVPNILVILTATYGIMKGDSVGIIVGLCCGLLSDVFFGTFMGLNAIFYMMIGFLNGKFHQVFYEDDVKLPLVLIFTSDLLYGLAYYVIVFLLRSRFDFSFYFLKIILPEVIYTISVTLIYYPILLLIHKLLERSRVKEGMRFV
ncbi:MAG: rod shape-determining protein MreD [Lachnospiraceae bacterium]|nr:rod shape-determining protein MreD [Lachnospiraceae bacterium]